MPLLMAGRTHRTAIVCVNHKKSGKDKILKAFKWGWVDRGKTYKRSPGPGAKTSGIEEYVELFQSHYMSGAVSSLEASLTKGMAWYSQEHDVYIGGKPHENSQFKLDELMRD